MSPDHRAQARARVFDLMSQQSRADAVRRCHPVDDADVRSAAMQQEVCDIALMSWASANGASTDRDPLPAAKSGRDNEFFRTVRS